MSNPYDRPFTVTLGEIRKGELANELTAELARLVASVMTVGKPGKLKLTISVKPAAKNSEMVVIEDDVVAAEPRPDRLPTLFYATDDGGLSRNSLTQPDLPFRQVPPAEEA
jgi:hypothetical protein